MAILTITTDIKVVIVTHRERIIEKEIENRKHNVSLEGSKVVIVTHLGVYIKIFAYKMAI